MGTIYCFGETMIQLYPRDPDAEVQDVLYFKKHIGGSAAVSAYSIACLGGHSGFIGSISTDGFGQFIRYTLKTAGVDLSACVPDSKNETSIMLAKGLKNVKEAGFYQPVSCKRELELTGCELTNQDILHISPQCAFPETVIIRLMDAAARAGCIVSLSLDGWPPEAADAKKIHKYISENLSRFSVVFASQNSLNSMGEGFIDGVDSIIKQVPILICFKADGEIFLYQQERNSLPAAAEIFSIPSVSAVNRQAVFAGAFLRQCMTALEENRWEGVRGDRSVVSEIYLFAAAAAAIGGTHRSGLLPFPAQAEVNRLILRTVDKNTQRKEFLRLAEMAKRDYYRLSYHVMPEAGWMNDPNGLIVYNGKYHVFYQTYPYAPGWGPMHWGHVTSGDLIHWEYLPFALAPDQLYEKGCYSGSAVDNNGELTLIYTAHDDARSPKEAQCIAFSADGVKFRKYEKNPVIPGPPEGFGEDFRDPKVFRRGDLWYLIAGCTKDRQGGILLYSSKDLRDWECLGLVCKSNGKQGEMWECPDLFELDNTWTLMVSPMNMKNSKTIFITGSMDFGTAAFTQKQWQDVDYGFEFYSPRTFQDDRGRRILIGWMDMWMGEYPTQKNGWSGALTFPRELFMKDGKIWQRPVEELQYLRKKELFNGKLSLREGKKDNLPGIKGDCMEISFTIPETENSGILTLYLRSSENWKERTMLSYNFNSRVFTIDKRQSGSGRPSQVTIPHRGIEKIPVHILIDKSSVEIFLGGGKYAVTHRIYPQRSSVYYDIFTESVDIEIPDLIMYELG
jgi:beta-fructofuranosidase